MANLINDRVFIDRGLDPLSQWRIWLEFKAAIKGFDSKSFELSIIHIRDIDLQLFLCIRFYCQWKRDSVISFCYLNYQFVIDGGEVKWGTEFQPKGWDCIGSDLKILILEWTVLSSRSYGSCGKWK